MITREMRREVRFHWKRTGVSARRLLRSYPPAFDGLTIRIVNDWIAGRVDMAISAHWNHVLSAWAKLPDCEAYAMRQRTRQKGPGRPRHVEGIRRIVLTQAMSDFYRSELIRTGADPARDIVAAPGASEGLTLRVLYSWRYRDVRTTREDHWAFAMHVLEAMPDLPPPFSGLSTR